MNYKYTGYGTNFTNIRMNKHIKDGGSVGMPDGKPTWVGTRKYIIA